MFKCKSYRWKRVVALASVVKTLTVKLLLESSQSEVEHIDILLTVKSGKNICSFGIQVLFSDSVTRFTVTDFHAVFVTPMRTGHLTEHSVTSRQKPHSAVVTLEAAALSHSIYRTDKSLFR